MLYPGDIGADPYALPELPAEWAATQVEPPPVEVAPVPVTPPVAPLAAPVTTVEPIAPPEEMDFAPDDFSSPTVPEQRLDAPDDFEAAMARDLDAEPDNAFIDDLLASPADPVDAEVGRQLGLSPEERLADVTKREAERADIGITGATELAEERERDAQDRYFDLKAARTATDRELADVSAKRAKLVKEGINENGWVDSLTGGQTVAAYILAAASGILAGTTGDKSGINYITGEIDKNIKMQQDNLQRQLDLLDQQAIGVENKYTRIVQEQKDLQVVQLAAYDVVEQRLAQQQVKYDPAGTTAATIVQQRLELQQKTREAEAALEKERFERQLKENEELRAQQKHAKAMRPAGTKRYTPEQVMSITEAGGTVAPEMMPLGVTFGAAPKANPKTVKLAAEADKAQSDAEKARRENDPAERARMLGVGGLKRKDGQPILFRNEGVAEKVGKAKAATDMAASLIDNLEVLRNDEGFSSDTIKSERWRQMQADYAALQLEVKNTAELGVLAGPDMEIIGRALGTNDPTEFRNVSAGLQAARKNLVNKLNYQIKSNDPEADRYEPIRTEAAKAIERTKDDNAAILKQPIPLHARGNEESRSRYVEAKKLAATTAVKRQNPAPGELVDWAKAIDAEVKGGSLTRQEAIAIVSPMATKVAKAERAKIQDASTAELKKLQTDRNYIRRAYLLDLVDSGEASPEQIYDFVTTGAK